MKRLVSLAVVVAFFIAIPQCLGQCQDAEKDASQLLEDQQLVQMFHLVMAQRPDTKICHLTPAGGALDQGFIMLVNDRSLDRHLNHGDCLDYNFTIDEPGEPCSCPPCPDGGVPPCA